MILFYFIISLHFVTCNNVFLGRYMGHREFKLFMANIIQLIVLQSAHSVFMAELLMITCI